MADQGPLVRVDTDGRRNLLKMTRQAAERYVAAHPGSSIVGATVTPAEIPHVLPTPPADAPAPANDGAAPLANPDKPGKPLDRMNKAELKAFALALGLSPEGSNAEIIERIKGVPLPEETTGDEQSNPEGDPPEE